MRLLNVSIYSYRIIIYLERVYFSEKLVSAGIPEANAGIAGDLLKRLEYFYDWFPKDLREDDPALLKVYIYQQYLLLLCNILNTIL